MAPGLLLFLVGLVIYGSDLAARGSCSVRRKLGWFGLLVGARSRARGAQPDERAPPSAKVQ